ncbi:MAG: Mpo1-like protein [Rudaea sp.]
MSIGELLRWQWGGYPRYHQSRVNLLIHIVAVPLFLLGTIGLIVAVVKLSLAALAIAIGGILVAVALQGRGHRVESIPPEPFTGPLNFVSRLFFEQWVTFPRFVFTGGWHAAFRKARER